MKYVLLVKEDGDKAWYKLQTLIAQEADKGLAEMQNKLQRWQSNCPQFRTAQFRILEEKEFRKEFGRRL